MERWRYLPLCLAIAAGLQRDNGETHAQKSIIGTLVLNELNRRTGSLVCPILMQVMMNAWVWYSILA